MSGLKDPLGDSAAHQFKSEPYMHCTSPHTRLATSPVSAAIRDRNEGDGTSPPSRRQERASRHAAQSSRARRLSSRRSPRRPLRHSKSPRPPLSSRHHRPENARRIRPRRPTRNQAGRFHHPRPSPHRLRLRRRSRHRHERRRLRLSPETRRPRAPEIARRPRRAPAGAPPRKSDPSRRIFFPLRFPAHPRRSRLHPRSQPADSEGQRHRFHRAPPR